MNNNLICGSRAHDMYKAARKWLVEHGPVRDIRLSKFVPAGDGTTRNQGDPDACHLIVGVGGIEDLDAPVRAGEAMLPLVALFHEAAGHAMQSSYEFFGTSRLQKALFYSHYASNASTRYYGVDSKGVPHEPYFRHPHEIAAQYQGIKCAKEWLSYAVGKDTAEAWLMDYVKLRGERESACYGEDASAGSIDAVLVAMDKAFQKSLDEPRIFELDINDKDALSDLETRFPGRGFMDKVKNCENGMRTDGMMAACWMVQMKNLNSSDPALVAMLSTKTGKNFEKRWGHMFVGSGSPVFPSTETLPPSLRKLKSLVAEMDSKSVPEIPDTGLESGK